MNETIRNLAVELFADTFDRLFTGPVRDRISDLTRQRRVCRQIEAISDSAAQGLARFLSWEPPADDVLHELFATLRRAMGVVRPEGVWPPVGPVTANVLELADCSLPVDWTPATDARFRVALELVVTAVWQTGAVLDAWGKVEFAASYEPPQTLVRQLEGLGVRATAHPARSDAVADEQFDLQYRDRLLQQWSQVEVGTLRAVSAVTVVLDDLFVIPRTVQTGWASGPEDPGTKVMEPATSEDELADKVLFDSPARLKISGRPPCIPTRPAGRTTAGGMGAFGSATPTMP